MAPISLKDTKITALTENLVSRLTKFKKSSRNFTLSSQFALSNFRYHNFLDVNSLQVSRLIEGVCQKFKVHSQFEKAEAFKDLCDEFLNAPISQSTQEVKTDAHYSLISLLLLLSNSPTHNDYQPREESSDLTDEDTFDWKAYLLGDAEEEILGIPHSGPLYDWSDDEILDSDTSTAPEDSGVVDTSLSEDQRPLTLYETEKPSVSTLTEKGRVWLSEHVVHQYWEEYPLSTTTLNNTSKYGQCTVADKWETFQKSQNPFHQSSGKKVLTETQIVRETIWILSGIGKSFVYKYNHKGIQVNSSIQVSHLSSDALQSLLKKFAAVGEQSHELQEFKASVLEDLNASQPSITMQAFANSLATYFKEYKSFLSDIEKSIIKKEATVTLLGLHDKLDTKMKEISVIHSVYQEGVLVHVNKPLPQRVSHLLDAFYHNIRISDALGSSAKWKVSILLRVFLDTARPCFEFIDNWVTSGTFNDPANEFFIQRNDTVSLKSASFWEEGITLPQAEPGSQQTPYLVPCFLMDLLQQILLAGKSVNLIQGLGKMAESPVSDAEGSSLYQNFLNSLLSAVCDKSAYTAEGFLGDDKVHDGDTVGECHIALANKADILAVTKEIGDPMLRESLLTSAVVAQSAKRNERKDIKQMMQLHSGLENCLVPVEVLIKKSLTPLLQTKYTQACGALISLLKSDYNLMDHLNAMKNFFLLEAGDTMHHFYLDIFKKIRRRQPWQDISYLNSLLQEALYPRFPSYIDRLAVSLTPVVSGAKSSSVQTLQSITLNYKVPWPVSLVIDENCLKKYNQVFLFLLTVKRAKWSLDELRFTDLSGETNIQTESSDNEDEDEDHPAMERTTTKKPVNQELIHKMHLLRFRLLHFVNGLHNYVMTRILHTTGLEFQEAILKAVDLNAVIAVHRAHVDKVFDRCLLSQKIGFVREAITKVLNLALLFQAKWDASVAEFNIDAYDKIDTEFSKCNHFVITFLGNIVKRGAFPHLEALAYSLSSSPSNTRLNQGISVR